MKMDKRKPQHWWLLLGFLLQGALGLVARRFRKRETGLVLLYGHKLNGNLLAICRYIREHPESGLRCVFLSMDAAYCQELEAQGFEAQWAAGTGCARLLAGAGALVSDHGLHALQPFLAGYQRAGLHFVDVWHGIPFKGFDAEDFRVQQRYDECWVASESQSALWSGKFGFDPDIVHATGYARTDQLVTPEISNPEAKRRLGLDPATCGKTLLFAPTWAQDHKGRSFYPFGCTEGEFLGALSAFAGRHGATILLRSHMNSGDVAASVYPHVIALPGTRYPDTEEILLASDLLVCDWSSIAFDFLLLDRPTIFLDVQPPFRKGFSLGPEYRFGSLVKNQQALLQALETWVTRPDEYWQAQSDSHRSIKTAVYGDKADGHAARRGVARLRDLLRITDG
ncbi:MAG: CDP-glycerol--glycerophosphate glycerophosphotransferase [Massilia sp.]|nr:MAG: CDP-glycerol--glycerophosphate glycerophosphotransferase [Massilia sp.]